MFEVSFDMRTGHVDVPGNLCYTRQNIRLEMRSSTRVVVAMLRGSGQSDALIENEACDCRSAHASEFGIHLVRSYG